jgi:hypothetical protein
MTLLQDGVTERQQREAMPLLPPPATVSGIFEVSCCLVLPAAALLLVQGVSACPSMLHALGITPHTACIMVLYAVS